ncbi:tetratricopeptide repeat protein [Staphylococcus canis]|uniref:Tetratricopeptide repeat protein n=1 Tax=Staphylococcus canis TaxID=2724942 RepID=A0ABS0T5P5_9STAP|nr:tetratricopeptide repeat protein [Staphylococcus canis]MBI5974072.1 tetratricopeptide repeat protein [Staphylococcus canis]
MTQLENVIRLHSDVSIYERLAKQNFNQQKYAKAKQYYDKVLELSPENFDAKHHIAQSYAKLGQPQRAEAIYFEMISQNENLEVAYYELSQLNIDLNEPNKAYLFGLNYAFLTQDEAYRDELESMFEVSIHNEDQLELESGLFVVQIIFQHLFGQGRLLEAREYILRQDEIIQEHKIIRNLLAMCYLYLSENKIAKSMFERLLKEDSTDIYALCHYTLLLYNMNETESFNHYVKLLNKVIPMSDDESFKLGIVLSYLKQYDSSQQLLVPLYKKGKFQTVQLYHALAFNSYYLGNKTQSEYFWERLTEISKVHPGTPPWIVDETVEYFNQYVKPLIQSDDQHRRLYGLFLMHQINAIEVLMTKEIWSIIDEMGNYEKLYLSYLTQDLQLTKLDFIHQGMKRLQRNKVTRQETTVFLSWINYAESLLEHEVDAQQIDAYVAAVVYLYFKTTVKDYTEQQIATMFSVTVDKLKSAVDTLLSI